MKVFITTMLCTISYPSFTWAMLIHSTVADTRLLTCLATGVTRHAFFITNAWIVHFSRRVRSVTSVLHRGLNNYAGRWTLTIRLDYSGSAQGVNV